MSIELVDLAFIVIMAVVMPLYGVWDFRRLKARIGAGAPDAGVQAYITTLVVEWSLTFAVAAWWYLANRDFSTIGLGFETEGWRWWVGAVRRAAAVCRSGGRSSHRRGQRLLRSGVWRDAGSHRGARGGVTQPGASSPLAGRRAPVRSVTYQTPWFARGAAGARPAETGKWYHGSGRDATANEIELAKDDTDLEELLGMTGAAERRLLF